jgi:LPS export ABC transporter protein LptC
MRRAWWLLPVLVVAGLWAWLAPRTLRPDAAAAADTPAADELGFAAVDAELIETGADGAPLYRLRAQRIEQQRPDAAVALESPQLSYDDRSQGLWTLHAERGSLSADRRSVSFNGAVQAHRTQSRSASLDLRTNTLQVDLQQRVADTATPVTIEWGRARLNADGLHADMVSGLFVLNGNGSGRLRY